MFMAGKKNAISTAAVSGSSEPCTALASMLSAKSARMVPGAACLRGHAERAAIILRDEDGLDGIAIADVEQPLDRAVGRFVLGDDGQALDAGAAFELVPQRLRQVGHLSEVAGALLVDPAEQLGGAEPLLAERGAERGQTLEVVIEQVGRHRMGL